MMMAIPSDPFQTIYLDRAVRDITESLGVRKGKESEFIRIVQVYIEKSYSSLRLAREALTDEKLSKIFIERHGKRIWSNKELVKMYHRVEWSQFASIADSL